MITNDATVEQLQKASSPTHSPTGLSGARASGQTDPFSSQAIFWRPRHVVASPLLDRLPFLFWLMETARPRKIVQLGLGDGLVYMALCQAAERLGGQTLCIGIDPEGAVWPDRLREQHDAQYCDISTLLPDGWPSDGARIAKGADIFILNTFLNDEQSRIIHDCWLPQLSGKAVVLTVDAAQVLGNPDLRRSLLENAPMLLRAGPMSPSGPLLDVTLHGSDQPERLRILAGADDASPMQLAARQVFGRLGKAIEDTCELASVRVENSGLKSTLATLNEKANELDAALTAARDEAEAMRHDRERARDMAEAKIAALQTRATAQSSGASPREAALEQQHAARIEDIAVLMQQNQAKLDEARQSHREELDALRHGAARMQARHDALVREIYASTSWRITRPMRGLKSAFLRR